MNEMLRTLICSTALIGALSLVACGESERPDAPPEAPESAAPAAPAEPAGTARITGVARYEGDVPRLPEVNMAADPACQALHDEPVTSKVLVLGEGQTLGNVFVKVTSGLPERQWAAPAEPVVIDQRGCLYLPKVVGVMPGQQVKFLNSDGILHNVHGRPQVNRPFNVGMPAERTEAVQTLSQPEERFEVKCDVHPWMSAFISVVPHPYFDTTETDGGFEIGGLPAGTYEIEAWHERLGTRTATVTVADGETGEVELVFTR